VVRGYPKRFVMKSVVIDGQIISDGNAFLMDGKAVSAPKTDTKAKADTKKK
jgi:hypothetical protein